MSVKQIRNAATGLLATVALSMTTIVAFSGAAQAQYETPPGGVDTGCPYGAVCIYPDASWNGGNPSHVFWSEGAHQFYDQYGTHRVYNNQYGQAYAALSESSDGSSWYDALKTGEYVDTNMTPYNSIRLWW